MKLIGMIGLTSAIKVASAFGLQSRVKEVAEGKKVVVTVGEGSYLFDKTYNGFTLSEGYKGNERSNVN